MITFYKILSYILLPIAAVLAAFTAVGLLMALANPAALLPLFLMACIVLYVFTSFSFLQKAIIKNAPVKARLRDWIRVNAFVALFVAIMNLMNGFTLLANPALMQQAVDQATDMMKQMNQPMQYDLMKLMKGLLVFIICFGAAMLVHIVLSFQLIKKYKDYFSL